MSETMSKSESDAELLPPERIWMHGEWYVLAPSVSQQAKRAAAKIEGYLIDPKAVDSVVAIIESAFTDKEEDDEVDLSVAGEPVDLDHVERLKKMIDGQPVESRQKD